MVKPITPNEIKKKLIEFPDFVIEAFNYCIQEKWNGIYARVNQNEAIDSILKFAGKEGKEIKRGDIFKNHWLDVEDTYRQQGWKVIFAKQPYYVTDDDDFFIFKKN